jgi:redox-sensitive bicupin YhaK (pirin superfamily)
MSAKRLMRVLDIQMARTTHPTGDPKFAVKQSFPAAFDEVQSDPFLMCDYFSSKSAGVETDPDSFPVRWHPHRGMDICTYMKAGVGRHGDSLGNRETFATPGMQWISVGSGIEHAESGGTPTGEQITGFQIWINVPAKHKMDDPEYGTVDPKDFPLLKYSNDQIEVRLLAGEFDGKTGPFRTKQKLQMVDYSLQGGQSIDHEVPLELDNCLLYVYEGAGTINERTVNTFQVLHLDAANRDENTRTIHFQAGAGGLSVMLFAGKRINEPIAWHGKIR